MPSDSSADAKPNCAAEIDFKVRKFLVVRALSATHSKWSRVWNIRPNSKTSPELKIEDIDKLTPTFLRGM